MLWEFFPQSELKEKESKGSFWKVQLEGSWHYKRMTVDVLITEKHIYT